MEGRVEAKEEKNHNITSNTHITITLTHRPGKRVEEQALVFASLHVRESDCEQATESRVIHEMM